MNDPTKVLMNDPRKLIKNGHTKGTKTVQIKLATIA